MCLLVGKERRKERKKGKKKSFKLRRGNERGFYTGIQGLDAKRSRLIFWRETNLAGVLKIDPVGLPKWVGGPRPVGPALKIRWGNVFGNTFFGIYVKN